MQQSTLEHLVEKALKVLTQIESILPPPAPEPDWTAWAFRWQRKGQLTWLEPIRHLALIDVEDLQYLEQQKTQIERNTLHFLQGKPANNVLMTGARGTGKSSLVRAMLTQFAPQGLRLIELDKQDLMDLTELVNLLMTRPEKFIIFCDDLSFEEGDVNYKALKSVLDGSIASYGDNVLIYATSNRRHLMPEKMQDNLSAHYVDGDLHPSESIEEKISLSERFGLWLSFYPFNQEQYWTIVVSWLRKLGCPETHIESARLEALQWATQRGSRSGRVAKQFAQDWTARFL